MVLTFQVLGSKQQAAYVMLLDKRSDMGRNRGAIEAHHKQLALYEPWLLGALAAGWFGLAKVTHHCPASCKRRLAAP